ncbi:hypothetical protein CDCA_CDCA06G1920 [Cyanidium caldarium]|uniref:GDT1 family protein n=1 Tax=Cyanidium caldarium TaxID=2771 RepID=A0AAV9IUC3_CYACA|nr:hypothetical protein CDCA_CDCA06G1920 [Cyanidium caldarium]
MSVAPLAVGRRRSDGRSTPGRVSTGSARLVEATAGRPAVNTRWFDWQRWQKGTVSFWLLLLLLGLAPVATVWAAPLSGASTASDALREQAPPTLPVATTTATTVTAASATLTATPGGLPADHRALLMSLERLRQRKFSVASYQSLGMILVTELGDKTFFLAAVLAARHSRLLVLQGALSALVIMTVLSAVLGRAFPSLFSAHYTSIAGAVLFLYFGVQMLRDFWRLHLKRRPSAGGGNDAGTDGLPHPVPGAAGDAHDELREVEEKLDRSKWSDASARGNHSASALANGGMPLPAACEGGLAREPNEPTAITAKAQQALWTVLQALFSPLFMRSFSLTFLAEWGDRSQIATIALAAHRNMGGVIFGAIVGHTICTSLAVAGGRLVAAKIPERFIALSGGVLFLVFGILSVTVAET